MLHTYPLRRSRPAALLCTRIQYHTTPHTAPSVLSVCNVSLCPTNRATSTGCTHNMQAIAPGCNGAARTGRARGLRARRLRRLLEKGARASRVRTSVIKTNRGGAFQARGGRGQGTCRGDPTGQPYVRVRVRLRRRRAWMRDMKGQRVVVLSWCLAGIHWGQRDPVSTRTLW